MLTLLDFKHPGIEDLLLDLQGVEKYTSAYDILTKVNNYAEKELRGEIGSVSVLLAELAEYLRYDAQSASLGTVSYMYSFRVHLKGLTLLGATAFERVLYKEMIENIEKISLNACAAI